ncbi:MAG: cyanophycin synthetase, partial [Pseudomonadota bacterium]
AVAHRLEVPVETIREGIAAFSGVKRRFTNVGTWNEVTVFDDYGHHPVEITAVLKAAREATDGRILAVVQPHRYTRLRDLFEGFCTCFNDADAVLVAPVYAAGEQPIEGFDRDSMVEGLQARGHRYAKGIDGPDDLPAAVRDFVEPGDMVICLGAGTITQWAAGLTDQLKAGDQ